MVSSRKPFCSEYSSWNLCTVSSTFTLCVACLLDNILQTSSTNPQVQDVFHFLLLLYVYYHRRGGKKPDHLMNIVLPFSIATREIQDLSSLLVTVRCHVHLRQYPRRPRIVLVACFLTLSRTIQFEYFVSQIILCLQEK